MAKPTAGYKAFRYLNVIFMVLVIVVTLFPVLNVAAKSFSDAKSLSENSVTIFPKGFNTLTYQLVMADEIFWIDYRNTVVYTLLGTLVSLALSAMFAYALSVPRLRGKQFFITFVVVTMFFNGGIIPNYLLVRNLGMRNTIWAIVIPGAISTFNVLIMKAFFVDIPRELEEAAMVDGMTTYGVLLKIILPLSKPILATMTLFYAVGAWNSWFGASIFLDYPEKYPVSIYLRNIIAGSMVQTGSDPDTLNQVASNIKAACIVLTAVPILCIYPFLQKYFVNGMMIGSVKG
jgi:putative aldouronate transport system permease protein